MVPIRRLSARARFVTVVLLTLFWQGSIGPGIFSLLSSSPPRCCKQGSYCLLRSPAQPAPSSHHCHLQHSQRSTVKPHCEIRACSHQHHQATPEHSLGRFVLPTVVALVDLAPTPWVYTDSRTPLPSIAFPPLDPPPRHFLIASF
jgi:hypothetical protein